MIKNFKHDGLEAFYRHGKKGGINPDHAKRLDKQLGVLQSATSFFDVKNVSPPGWEAHQLKWKMKDSCALSVSGNWRLMWRFEGSDVVDLDYLDYH